MIAYDCVLLLLFIIYLCIVHAFHVAAVPATEWVELITLQLYLLLLDLMLQKQVVLRF